MSDQEKELFRAVLDNAARSASPMLQLVEKTGGPVPDLITKARQVVAVWDGPNLPGANGRCALALAIEELKETLSAFRD